MENIYAFMPVILASSFTTTILIMAAFLLNRKHSSRRKDYKYPVQEEPAPENASTMLEEEAAVYDVSVKRSADLLSSFRVLMEVEKPFLDPDLIIEDLAVRLGTNKTTLSRLINRNFGMNFRQLLNSYKVKEAIMLFSKDNTISMDDLRKASGFKSSSTFTSSFSRFTGCTPGEYCKRVSGR